MSENKQSLRSRVSITLRYGEERAARSVAEALSPDNLDAPQGIRVKSLASGNNIIAVVEGERSLETIVSTIEDLLSCVQAAERAIGSIRGLMGEKDKSLSPSNKPQSSESP